jgi:hypothetical protein
MTICEETINHILENNLRNIYGKKLKNIEIISTMQYPGKENKFLVIYNLNLEDSLPIIRAKIIVDVNKKELETYEPGLP